LLIISLNAVLVILLSTGIPRLLNSSLYINILLVFAYADITYALNIQHVHTSLTVEISLRVLTLSLLEILILHLLLGASVVSVHLAAIHSATTGICLGLKF
jgi:hypothetical protein